VVNPPAKLLYIVNRQFVQTKSGNAFHSTKNEKSPIVPILARHFSQVFRSFRYTIRQSFRNLLAFERRCRQRQHSVRFVQIFLLDLSFFYSQKEFRFLQSTLIALRHSILSTKVGQWLLAILQKIIESNF
jgi:hypothetical protein